MIRAIIFDFDGLILETEEPTYQSWAEVYQSFGFSLPFSTWISNVGTTQGDFNPQKELEHRVAGQVDWIIVEAWRKEIENTLIEAQPLLPGAEQYLYDARRSGYLIGLASNSPTDWVQRHLARLGLLECFDCLCTSDFVQRIKPDPELYLNALAALKVEADEAIALEDSLIGVLAAKRAEIFCVAVPNPLLKGLIFNEADLQIQSLDEMPLEQLLEQILVIKTQRAAS
jgi:HAD superfamily hydrolase (TIGR01509 family)